MNERLQQILNEISKRGWTIDRVRWPLDIAPPPQDEWAEIQAHCAHDYRTGGFIHLSLSGFSGSVTAFVDWFTYGHNCTVQIAYAQQQTAERSLETYERYWVDPVKKAAVARAMEVLFR